MAQLILISWRDIPSQVVIRSGRQTRKAMLSARFQQAIDRAAMRAGKTGSEDYIADWRRAVRESVPRCDDQALASAVEGLEARYSDADLLRIIRAHGVDNKADVPFHLTGDE